MRILIIAATIILLGTSVVSAAEIKPEMVVKFTKGGIACMVRDDLLEITLHAIKREDTKSLAMMIGNGGSCIMLSPNKSFKVISSEYNDSNVDIGVLEVVGADIISLHGAWAFSIGAEEIRAPPARSHKN